MIRVCLLAIRPLQKAISLSMSLVIRVCCSPYGLSRGPFRCAPIAFAHHTASLEGHFAAPVRGDSRLLAHHTASPEGHFAAPVHGDLRLLLTLQPTKLQHHSSRSRLTSNYSRQHFINTALARGFLRTTADTISTTQLSLEASFELQPI